MPIKKAYAPVKYPRVEVSQKRHEKLAKQAARERITIKELVERKLAN